MLFAFSFFFFFSSRRRHTRYIGDWSSDVCSSDLGELLPLRRQGEVHHGRAVAVRARSGLPAVLASFSSSRPGRASPEIGRASCRKSVDLGGRRIIKKKKRAKRAIGEEQRETVK